MAKFIQFLGKLQKTPKFHFNLYIKHETIYIAKTVNDTNCDMS